MSDESSINEGIRLIKDRDWVRSVRDEGMRKMEGMRGKEGEYEERAGEEESGRRGSLSMTRERREIEKE